MNPAPQGAPPPRTDSRLVASRTRMKLANVVTGPTNKPPRILLYGVDGIGKTTFAYNAPSPIFIGLEDGFGKLKPPRFPEPQTWLEVLAAVDELATTDHPYKTLAIDTLDWLEPLCWAHVIYGRRDKQGRPIESIGDIGYNQGFNAAVDEWRVLLSRLDHLRAARAMTIILIAHSWIRPFKNPEGEDYDRHEAKLHVKASGLIREWADIVLFATHETYTHDLGGRTKGVSTGARIMHTERAAAFDAKNRHNLPPTLPLDWSSLQDAIAAGEPADPELLRGRIAAGLESAEPALRERVQRAVEQAGADGAELARIHNKLQAQLNIKRQQEGGI